MSLAKLTRFFVVRRAGPSETEGLGDRNSSSAVLRTGAGTWIDNFIRVLNVASALGGSFPPLKAATETLNVILEDFRDVRNNTASLQDLVTEITELLNVLNDWVESHGETVSKNTGLMELFNKFNLYLSVMKNYLDNILTKSHKSFGKRTLHKDALNRLIVDYVQRMNNLRLNFLVQLSLDTRRVIATASHSEGKDRGIFDDLDTSDYYKYKPADIHLTEILATEDRSHRDRYIEESYARVEDKRATYTFRRYTSSDALTMFREEFTAFSQHKHPNIRQIFGVCESKLTPGILFQGKLVRLRDYSKGNDIARLLSWLYFYHGYKAVTSYFKSSPCGVYSIMQYFDLYDWSDVYIDISTDLHNSVWPVPQGSDDTTMSDIISHSIQPDSPLPPPQSIAFVLQQRSLPLNTNTRSLLAGFYHTMKYVMHRKSSSQTLCLPLPLLDSNEVYIMGTHGLGRVRFEDKVLGGYESLPWKCIAKEIPAVDMGEWTRFTVLPGIFKLYTLSSLCSDASFYALLPQLRRMVDGSTPTFELVDSITILIRIWRLSDENEGVAYCFVHHLNLSRDREPEIHWSSDPNGRSKLGWRDIHRLGLCYYVELCKGDTYAFTDLHLNAIKVFHDVCGYGGEDGEERLLRLFGNPRAYVVPD